MSNFSGRVQRAQGRFAQIPAPSIPRSKFNRTSGRKTTFDAGHLVPIFVDEALPGDTFSMSVAAACRLATLLHPIMDNLYVDLMFFAVPNRLVWDNWERFNGAQDDPDDSTDYLVPQIVSDAAVGFITGSLYDYFGLPTGIKSLSVSALPARAYTLIYNEWFRDQNLQDSVPVAKDDGPDLPTEYSLKRRGKRHDYFTSALPWPQKGQQVSLPLGTSAPVVSTGDGQPTFDYDDITDSKIAVTVDAELVGVGDPTNAGVLTWNDTKLETDLSTATAATINALREAVMLQRLFERDARGGTRYTEILRSHFGVISPDQRLQRPEYLGGGTFPVIVHQVAQTSEENVTPLAELAAYATAHTGGGIGFVKSFVEHSIIIGLACVRADLTYQQGLERMWSRRERYDYFWPELANLGEQAILNKEIYAQGSDDATADEEVFGYQERYAEYRYKPSVVTGLFRSNAVAPLDTWHLALDFDALPVLNDSFIKEDPPVDRVIAVPSEPHLIGDFLFQLTCARPMPAYAVPGGSLRF